MMGATQRQDETLAFIKRYLARHNVPPTHDEIREHLGLRSKSAAHRLVRGLEGRRLIRCLPVRARGIEVVTAPDIQVRVGPDEPSVQVDTSLSADQIISLLPALNRKLLAAAAARRIEKGAPL